MTNGNYTITLLLNVTHAGLLWDAAAARVATTGSLNAFEIVDTIGPREDPNVADCLAMLLDPSTMPGCQPVSWRCAPDVDLTRSAVPAAAPSAYPPLTIVADRPRSITSALPNASVAC